jgi:uncharacterized protein YggT (Ycf19 family)
MKLPLYRLLISLVLLLSTSIHADAWEWSYFVGDPVNFTTKTLTLDEVTQLRVRDIKRRLVRQHGYGADEVARVLDKKELIEALAFEEHKIRQKELEQVKRNLVWKGIFTALLVAAITLFWPLLRHLWEVASINFIVYTDRKRFEAQRCWDYRSVQGCVIVLLMGVLDLAQLWMTVSILLSWFTTSRYFFPMPNLSIRPAALMGGPISQGPLAGYGINLAPMALSWAFRFVHARLEGFVGLALKSAQKRQKKQQRAKETPEERAARKSAKHAAREAAQQQASQKMQEPDVRPLTADEIREAAALAAERRRSVIESNTALDDLD